MEVVINNKKIPLSNIKQIYNKEQNLTKADVIDFYIKIAPFLLSHLKNRPFTMIHFPDADKEKSFYQKQCPADAPTFVKTIKLPSKERGEIKWVLVNNLETLVYLVNRSVLEMHCFISQLPKIEVPSYVMFDLDPSNNATFKDAVKVALTLKQIFDKLNLQSFIKTSGSKGLHIVVPVAPKYSFKNVEEFATQICTLTNKLIPNLTTQERLIKNRGDKIYLDSLQNHLGKTMASVYSMRVKNIFSVSTPLKWEEVNEKLSPFDFNVKTIFARLEKVGDLWQDIYKIKQNLPNIKGEI